MVKKIVLAYSGGLDTSVMIPWLIDSYGCKVVAMCADLGQGEELKDIEQKAIKSGAEKVYVEDLKDEFAEGYLFKLIKSGAIYEGRYLLGTSIARPLIASKQVEIAREVGADALAHGATGKGNDQVRFELAYKALAPDLKVIAPWREWDIAGRKEEIEYAKKKGIPVPVTKSKPYSSDRNLWHISFEGGVLEDPNFEPPEDMFVLTKSLERVPDKPTYIDIEFKAGIPVKLNGEKLSGSELIQKLNKIGGENGVGRVDIVENRLVGIKSRGVYETPGGTILMIAHKDLESITLDKDVVHYKERVSLKYAELVYNGQWFTPIREALDAFIDKTQEAVTGTVRLKLYKGSCTVVGRKSPNSLYDPSLATFEKEAVYNQKDAQGFINLFGLPYKVAALLKKKRK